MKAYYFSLQVENVNAALTKGKPRSKPAMVRLPVTTFQEALASRLRSFRISAVCMPFKVMWSPWLLLTRRVSRPRSSSQISQRPSSAGRFRRARQSFL